MSETIKLCPYRRESGPGLGIEKDGRQYTMALGDFAPCLQDKCAMWRTVREIDYEAYKPGEFVPMEDIKYVDHGYCGLAGKHYD